MLYIYDDLLQHIKQLYPERVIQANIGKSWHVYRYIQISTPLEGIAVHYEYINGHVELHFEDDSVEKNRRLIDYLMQNTGVLEGIEWDESLNRIICRDVAVVETKSQLDSALRHFIGVFDELIKKDGPKVTPCELGVKDSLDNQGSSVDMYIMSLKDIVCLPLAIPDYQRIYCWEEYNVKCLLTDIIEQMERSDCMESSYRLGTIILHRHGGKYDIIDGQQRLVTLSIILQELGVVPALLKERFNSSEAHKYVAYNKFLVSNFIQKRVADRKKLKEVILNHLDFSVLVLQNTSIDLAYTFFSNENSRGVSLSDYDLLKAHHLRFIPQSYEQQSKKAAETWNQMIQRGREEAAELESPDYERVLDAYIYRLRRWMRKEECSDSTNNRRVKREYEAAPIIDEIPPFGEEFYFNEPIQGGNHFFSYVEHHLIHYKHFVQTEEFKCLHNSFPNGSAQWYRDAIEALLFGYYLKFGELCLADAAVVLMRIALQHRYENDRTRKASIMSYLGGKGLILMIDQATSPTFFLAEARNLVREMPVIYLQDLKPIQKDMKGRARIISKRLEKGLVVDSFKKLNV